MFRSESLCTYMCVRIYIKIVVLTCPFSYGCSSTIRALLDWFEVDLGFTNLFFSDWFVYCLVFWREQYIPIFMSLSRFCRSIFKYFMHLCIGASLEVCLMFSLYFCLLIVYGPVYISVLMSLYRSLSIFMHLCIGASLSLFWGLFVVFFMGLFLSVCLGLSIGLLTSFVICPFLGHTNMFLSIFVRLCIGQGLFIGLFIGFFIGLFIFVFIGLFISLFKDSIICPFRGHTGLFLSISMSLYWFLCKSLYRSLYGSVYRSISMSLSYLPSDLGTHLSKHFYVSVLVPL